MDIGSHSASTYRSSTPLGTGYEHPILSFAGSLHRGHIVASCTQSAEGEIESEKPLGHHTHTCTLSLRSQLQALSASGFCRDKVDSSTRVALFRISHIREEEIRCPLAPVTLCESLLNSHTDLLMHKGPIAMYQAFFMSFKILLLGSDYLGPQMDVIN
jgi:hypothetical protein